MDPVLQFFKDEKEREGSRNQTIDQVVQGFFENTKGELGVPLTKSGQHVFMDMDGHKVFTYEGWKENQEAAVAWTELAGAALDHLKKGFEKDGGSWSDLPVRGTEAALTAVDSALELGSGIGRFVARSWRDDEEENQAAYDAYLRMTANFNRRYSGKSFVGDLHRGLGTGAGAEADAMVDPQWADAWGMLLDPVWLIPGGQATKVSKLMNTGATGQKLAAAAGKVAQLAQKVPGATAASTMAGKLLGAPVSQTAAGVGRVIEGFGKAGTWVGEKAGSSRALGIAAGGAAGVTAFSTLDEADSDWIKWLGSAGAAYGTAKALPFALAKGGSVVSGAGQSIHAAAKAAEMGLGRAANLGRYSDGLARKMKVIDNAPVNFLLRNSNNLANYAVRGAAFGAGMGYLVAGKEGAASGIGVGLVGGPLGAVQGKVITGVDRVSFHKPDGDGGWLRVDAKSILDVPYKDLVTNWMADMPAENRTALAEWAAARGKGADRILHGMAMVEMFAKGLLTKVDDEKVGDINVLYIRDDDHMAARFPEHPEFQGVEGFQHVDSNGKPVAVVNLQHSKDPLYTLTHEIFHPDWKTADPENPLAMARAELEGVFFGVKDIEGNEVVKGMFDEDQFLSLEDQYLSRLHGDDDASIQKHKDDRSMPERRSHIAAELISDAGGMFALASGGDMAAHANKVLRRAKVDDFTQKYFKFSADKFRAMLAGKTRSALERIGITFDAGGDPVRSPLFRDPRKLTEYASGEESGQTFWDFDSPQGKPITNSPEINRIIAEYVKNKNKLHEHLTVQESDPDGGVAVTAKQILSKQDTNSVQRMASSGMFALNPDGTVKFQGGRPVLLSKKERDMIAEAQSAAIYKALESVDVPDDQKPFALVRFGEGDESYYRGRYMSREQLDAVMALPDEVLPASIKARIVQLNSGLAKGFDSAGNLVGDPASNLLISYFKATSGSRYTSRAKMNWQVSSPYGWNISRAGNFNLQTFSIVRFENKLNRWWGKAGNGNKSYQNFFGLFGGSKDQFRADVIKYLDNQARGVQNPAGQKKDAIFDFLNVADIDNKRMMPDRLSTDARNEHVVPVSLRVDRMAEINPSMGDAMPVNWRRLNANFMPATKPKNVKPEAGGRQGMGRGEGAGPEVRYMPAGDRHAINIIKGTESPEGLPARPTILNLARYFQNRFDDPIDFKKSTPDQNERFESSVYDEVKHAMEIHPEAKGWYDENLGLAMSVLKELDPDIAKTENDFFFKAFLAVTSDGNKVDPQFKQAWKTYEHWKDTGEITGDFVSGDRITNIRNNLKVIDAVSKKLGPKKAAEWLTRKGTVKELRESAINDLGFTPKDAKKLGTGENVDAVIPFASIFGPKLGSFFNNLYGDYSTVTMDRWFMRTIGRNTGTQVKDPTAKQVKDAKNRLRLAVDMLTPAERKALGITKAAVKGEGYIDASKKLGVHFTIKKNRENVSAAVNEVRLSANAIAKMQKPLVEAPQGGGHRKWIRDRINAVQKRLKADGVDLENADLQALLWYNEKELYESAGVRGPKGANDYASAAESLYATVRGRPSEIFTGGAGRVGGIGRGKGDSKLGKPAVDPSVSYMPAGDVLPALNVRNELSNKFADDIVAGKKIIETRNSPSMDSLVGKRIKIIRTTGVGDEAMVIGEATVGDPIFYKTEADFYKDYEKHLVPRHSSFKFTSKGKWGYPMLNAEKYDKPYKAPKNKGIVFTKNVGGPIEGIPSDPNLRIQQDLQTQKKRNK